MYYPFESALLRLVRFASPEVPHLSAQEWQPVAQVARREGVTPLVYAALRAVPGGAQMAPDEVASALEAGFAASAAAARDQYAQLAVVTGALRSAGIEALVLKGAALARFVYPEAALRPFTDLDLLVRPRDIDGVHATLTAQGYDIAGGRPSEADRIWRHGRGYFDPLKRRVSVDVHWRYVGYPLMIPLDYEGVFDRTSTVAVNGQAARVPSGADMLVALSAHFLRELWYGKPRLRYLRDIAEVCGRGQVEWTRLPQVVGDAPLLRGPLSLALASAASLLAAPVAAEVLSALRPRRWGTLGLDRKLEQRVRRNVMREERPIAALGQVASMRWLDAGFVPLVRWLWTLLAVPRPLTPSQRRWLRYLTGGQFTGARPVD